jgi:hypothetical protein
MAVPYIMHATGRPDTAIGDAAAIATYVYGAILITVVPAMRHEQVNSQRGH